MGKEKVGGPPATWEMEIIFIYCDLCIHEIELGNRPTTHFTREGWRNITKNFNDRAGRTYDRTQLKNKWDQLKKEWKIWKELLRGETGIGWNPIKKTIDASEEWWKEKLQAIPAAKKFRYNGIMPELEERLDRMFGRTVATGYDSWMPSSGVLPPDCIDTLQHSSDENESQNAELHNNHCSGVEGINMGNTQRFNGNSSSHIRGRKAKKARLCGKQLFMTQIDELVDASRSISAAITASITAHKNFTIQDALQEIARIPEIFEDTELYYFATQFMQDKAKRDTFMSLPADRKIWWFQRCFEERTD